MSTVKVKPSKIFGTVVAPASKSAMQRACAAALLHEGSTVLFNPGYSNDDRAAVAMIEHLGATVIAQSTEKIIIKSAGVHPVTTSLNCGESGLGVRMFTPLAALSNQLLTINGSGSLLNRPMDFFDDILPKLGVEISSQGGKLPLQIKGPIVPNTITIDGSLSSQFLTGLLFAFAKAATEEVIIHVVQLKSKPYIDLTLQVLEHFGYSVRQENYERFYIQPLHRKVPNEIEYTVEGDWSGAAFLLVAGALAGNITVKGLDVFSKQADKAVLQALMQSKAIISIQSDKIEIGPGKLQAFHFDATDCPDLFPPLVALASACEGTSVIEGVSRLAHKESNRALTLQETFGKLGIKIQLQDDLMLIEGGTPILSATIHSHHDHRIAMAGAVAALRAIDVVTIEEAEAIDKSYPAFYAHLQQLGATVDFL
ncbi:MAG: 3-phosphoshikimate 1-carboxyvinyltransferase [Ferruginibacter sp.]